jgi:hypothetical protein
MDAPPPPPRNYNPPLPPGYAAYGTASVPKTTNGVSVASLVVSLVGLIPWFWLFQFPGLLGVIFGLVGWSQIVRSNGLQKGKGLAITGLVIGILVLVGCAVIWAWIFDLISRGYECEIDVVTVSCVYVD